MQKCAELVTKRFEEKEKRKRNVIVHNVPESKDSEIPKRIDHDATYIKELWNKLDVTDNLKIEKFHRIGKKNEDGKSRPLLIKLQSSEERELVLGRGYRCRNYVLAPECKQVAIAPDLSKEEREVTKNLLQKLHEMRKNDPDLVLRQGKIVKRKMTPKTTEKPNEADDTPAQENEPKN